MITPHQQAFYQALGIEVWRRRSATPAVAPAPVPTAEATVSAPEPSPGPEKAATPKGSAEARRLLGMDQPSEAVDMEAPEDPGPPADVEEAATKTDAASEADGSEPDAPEPAEPESQPTTPSPASSSEQGTFPDAFVLRCFRLGHVFVVIGEDAWAQRRLIVDVARALNGFEPGGRIDIHFEWPQSGLTEGADRAFKAFFGHRTGDDGMRALIAGALPLELLGKAVPEASALVDGMLYVAPNAASVEDKKTLWKLIVQMG